MFNLEEEKHKRGFMIPSLILAGLTSTGGVYYVFDKKINELKKDLEKQDVEKKTILNKVYELEEINKSLKNELILTEEKIITNTTKYEKLLEELNKKTQYEILSKQQEIQTLKDKNEKYYKIIVDQEDVISNLEIDLAKNKKILEEKIIEQKTSIEAIMNKDQQIKDQLETMKKNNFNITELEKINNLFKLNEKNNLEKILNLEKTMLLNNEIISKFNSQIKTYEANAANLNSEITKYKNNEVSLKNNLEKIENENKLLSTNMLTLEKNFKNCDTNLNSILSNNIYKDLQQLDLFSEKYRLKNLNIKYLLDGDITKEKRVGIFEEVKKFIIFKIFRIVDGYKFDFQNETQLIDTTIFTDTAFIRFILSILLNLNKKNII